jgi:hypothetical protein
MKLLVALLALSLLTACEPKPPKPKVDFTHVRSAQ